MVRYIRVPKFCDVTGYTDKAVRGKIETGVWIEGRHYRKAPDGHVLIDIEGYQEWVEQTRAAA